jgi:hypothetical protein
MTLETSVAKRADLAATLRGLPHKAEGGRIARKHGGKTGKGKMSVNIVIAPGHGGAPPMAAGPGGPPPPMPLPPRPPVPMPPPGMPPGGLPPGMGAGMAGIAQNPQMSQNTGMGEPNVPA